MLAFASTLPGSFWIGFGLALAAGAWLAGTLLVRLSAHTVRGEIIEMEWHLDHGQCEYTPHFRYVLPDGRMVTRRSAFAFAGPRYAAGDVVEVLYHPDEPEDAEIKLRRSYIELPAGVLVAGLGLMALALTGLGG